MAQLDKKRIDLVNAITTLYEQQLYMYENHTHSIENRIVSLSPPWIRPIIRGKTHANTEFGAKLYISTVDGYTKIELLSFDAFNGAADFSLQWVVSERIMLHLPETSFCVIGFALHESGQKPLMAFACAG